MRVSIIVPVYNAAPTLAACIDGLEREALSGDLACEIVMVDNNSTDGSPTLLERDPRVRQYKSAKQGAYAARNVGVAAALGDVLVFTDPDCVAEPGWLEELLRPFEDPAVEIVLGGYARPRRPRGLSLLVAYENEKDAYVLSSGDPTLYYGHTNNMAVRRGCFDAVGPFVERRRGADTIFVQRTVARSTPSAVAYAGAARVEHLEVDGLFVYTRKMAIYGHSRESYRAIAWPRPLTLSERWRMFRRVVDSQRLSLLSAGYLLLLLASGLAAWSFGQARARVLPEDRGVAAADQVAAPVETPAVPSKR